MTETIGGSHGRRSREGTSAAHAPHRPRGEFLQIITEIMMTGGVAVDPHDGFIEGTRIVSSSDGPAETLTETLTGGRCQKHWTRADANQLEY